MPNLPHELIGEFIDAVAEDRATAETLLREHADLLNARWIHNETVLHFLAIEDFVEGVRFLVAHGADVNTVNEFGDSPLVDVAQLGRDQIAEILLKGGANPNGPSSGRDRPLHHAARIGHVRLVGLLLRAGADARYVDRLGETIFDALDEAQPQDRNAIRALLAERGIVPHDS
jgi:ankyrin repeat protein